MLSSDQLNNVTGARELEWLAGMLLIRRVEEQLLLRHGEGLVPGFPTQYIGQEATAVGVIAATERDDVVFSTHRNRGHVLSRGADPSAVLAEVMCRATGTCGGRGGAMHVSDATVGVPYTSAMVGGGLPLAAGWALAMRHRGDTDRVVVAFFGDGVLEEGVFAETINIAVLWKLPVLLVCENNSFEGGGLKALEYPVSDLAAGAPVDLAGAYGLPTSVVDGADPGAVDAAARDALAAVRSGGGPVFIEARTVRWPGNRLMWPSLATGVTDIAMAWAGDRIPGENTRWYTDVDPVLREARRLIGAGQATTDDILALDTAIVDRVDEAARVALAAPFPSEASSLRHRFVEAR